MEGMIMKRKIGILLLLVFLCVSILSVPVFAATSPIKYVALGDSIATGSTSRGTTKSYVYSIRDTLIANNGAANVSSYISPVNGATSTDLLAKLRTDTTLRSNIANATLITISIGGNNVMKAGKNSFSYIDPVIAEAGVQKFIIEYPNIIAEIKAINKISPKILSTTLYNPYNIGDVSGYSNNRALQIQADGYIKRINDVIRNTAAFGANYQYVDVYGRFITFAASKKMGSYTYFYPIAILQFLRDPHPNQAGQNEIFNLHKVYLP
jgi:lysophospholipase L1-like esterase